MIYVLCSLILTHCSHSFSTVVATRCPPVSRAPPQFLEPPWPEMRGLIALRTEYQLTPIISPVLSLYPSVLLSELPSKTGVLVSVDTLNPVLP